jgi:hypothetical protein
MKRALERLERRGKGVLLLHDIQPATALMLPRLLWTLKSLGYHIVSDGAHQSRPAQDCHRTGELLTHPQCEPDLSGCHQ